MPFHSGGTEEPQPTGCRTNHHSPAVCRMEVERLTLSRHRCERIDTEAKASSFVRLAYFIVGAVKFA